MNKTVEVKKISIDVDGVILDLYGAFCSVYNKRNGTNFTKKKLIKYNFFLDWGIPKEEAFILFRELQENSVTISLEDVSAPFYIRKLNNKFTVDVVTARPEPTKSALIEILDSIGITKGLYYRSICLTPTYPLDIKIVFDYDLYIDDNPELAKSIKKRPDKAMLLFDQPWNRSVKCKGNVIRVKNWKEIYNTIETFFEPTLFIQEAHFTSNG